jgi:rare lipoprotein A
MFKQYFLIKKNVSFFNVLFLGILYLVPAFFSLIFAQNTKKIYTIDYKEIGIASYIPDKFNMRVSASGEEFDNSRLLGAHPSLPFKSIVKITNLSNNKSVIVTIIDRGPFAYGRMIDISKSAAERINLTTTGSAKVEMMVLSLPTHNDSDKKEEITRNNTKDPKKDNPKNDNKENTKNNTYTANAEGFLTGKIYDIQGKIQVFSNWSVQVATFKTFALAKKHTQYLKEKGLSMSMIYIFMENDQKFCVWYGNFLNRTDAEQVKKTVFTQYNVSGFLKAYK